MGFKEWTAYWSHFLRVLGFPRTSGKPPPQLQLSSLLGLIEPNSDALRNRRFDVTI